jgi:hypothetical protein
VIPPRDTQMGERYLLVVSGEPPVVVLGAGEVPEAVCIDGHLFRSLERGDDGLDGLGL